MPQRELPGFYYDETKQKYFRIQQNHVSPAGSAYTKSSVKALKAQKEIKERYEKHIRRSHQGLIKRSRLRRSTAILEYRIHPSGSVRALIANDFARRLSSRPAVCGNFHAQPCRPNTISFHHCFNIDVSGCLTTAFTQTISPRFGVSNRTLSLRPISRLVPGYYAFILPVEGAEEQCSVLGSVRPSLPRPYFAVSAAPALVTTYEEYLVWGHDGDPRSHPNPHLIMFDELHVETIWQLAVLPLSGSPGLAMATNTGLLFLTNDSTLASLCDPRLVGTFRSNSISTEHLYSIDASRLNSHEQMTATFKDSHVVMSGQRSGLLNFTDIRHPQSSVRRLKHPSAIISTLPTKHDHLILVQGFRHISIYNLHHIQAVNDRKPGKPSKPHLAFAVPVDRRSNAYIVGGLKMAYSSELGLVAAASSNISSPTEETHRVTLYSIATGRVIPSPLNNHVFTNAVTCIDIKRLRDGPESIITLSGGDLLEWTCHNDGEDEDESLTQREARFAAMSKGKLHDMRMEAVRVANESEATLSMAEEWDRGNKGPLR